MRTLCYSVRLAGLDRISDKAYRATAFDGSSDIIPASQVFGRDFEVVSSDAWWVSAWILERKSIQYSRKKQAWFDEHGRRLPTYEEHVPAKQEPRENLISELKR